MAERVFLHVGTPKSGTTYLQTILWQNVARLKADGLLVPGRFETHYAAAKAVTGRSGLRRDTRIDAGQAWPRLTNQANRWQRDALVSHELFAPAMPEQAQAAKAALRGAELHLIVTARALHHQIPASWQEQVKSGLPTPYEVFLERVRDEQAKGSWFWEVQDVAAIARRWCGDDIAPERIHIVTVPPDRSDPTLLWRRYASVIGLDPLAYDISTPVRNASLGVVESELLRRIHELRDERFTDSARHPWTRKLLATKTLSQRGGDRVRLPDSTRAWLSHRSAAMCKAVEAAGYHVVGDLSELEPRTSPREGTRDVASVTRTEIDEAAAWTVARLTEELRARQSTQAEAGPGPGSVASSDNGLTAILDLLEQIRALDTGSQARSAAAVPRSRRRAPLSLITSKRN
jgi:hypothetical protein